MSMKDDNLKNAINDLPKFEAPEVWDNIENNIKTKRRKFIIPIIVSLLVVVSVTYILIDDLKSVDNEIEISQNYQTEQIVDQEIEAPFIVYEENPIEYTEAGDSQITKITEQTIVLLEEQLDEIANETKDIVDEEISEVNNEMIVEEEIISEVQTAERIVYIETGDNLVCNPSFEDFRICPSGIVGKPSRKLIPDWQVPTKGTPDYFNVCSKKEAGVPENFAGRIDAHSGNGYAGMILRQNFTRDNKITGEKAVIYREYLQNELKSELKAGKTYKITFWVCNSTNSRFAVDGVGASMTIENEWTSHKEIMELIPVIENPIGSVLMNRDYWVAIEGYYTALGGEKFITIGNFRNNFSTQYMMQDNASAFNYSYYYIDDVSVIEVEEVVETYIVDDNVQENDNMSLNGVGGDW